MLLTSIMPHSTSTTPPLPDDDSRLPDAPSLSTSEHGSSGGENGIGKDDNIKIDIKLEDLFNDEDDDEEFPSSAATNEKSSSRLPTPPL